MDVEWAFDDSRAIYTQLVEQIERAVVLGVFPPGGRLPGVRELAASAGVNPNTMQRALAELEMRGLVYSQRTSGRFVTEDTEKITSLRRELARQLTENYKAGMRALGLTGEEMAQMLQEPPCAEEKQ